jgi:hypothetical protein
MLPLEGINKDQEKQIRIKTRAPTMPEEVKWNKIYKVIFPDDDESNIPSPCELSHQFKSTALPLICA